MPSRGFYFALLALGVALLAVVSQLSKTTAPSTHNYVQGKNNTLLFVVNDHPGFSNVHIATAQSLLEFHPDIEIHFVSFPRLSKTVDRIVSFAKQRQPLAKDIAFYSLEGQSYTESFDQYDNFGLDDDGKIQSIAPPGLQGIKQLSSEIQLYISPWNQDQHLSLFRQITAFIGRVDPAVVVLDTLFLPAREATRAANRTHAFVTPNMLIDNFPDKQPRLGMLWKYPAMGSGYPFPVPLNLVLSNIYLNFLFISNVIRTPILAAKRAFLAANGVPDPINFYGLYRPDVPWISQTTAGATVPVDFVPQNVTCTGPITVWSAPAEEQDPELMRWVSKTGTKTVLVNLGSAFTYSRNQTRNTAGAILRVVEATPDLQVLWKYKLSPNVKDFDWKEVVGPLEATGRVRVESWLSVDPYALLDSGHIAAFVTHGGAGGFHESIAAGVPQVTLPLWADLYGYAQLAEQTGVGIWACREISPDWTPECLSRDILRVAAGPESAAYLTKAKEIRKEATAQGRGRDIAAAIVADLARTGRP